jgi:hypothetical protein
VTAALTRHSRGDSVAADRYNVSRYLRHRQFQHLVRQITLADYDWLTTHADVTRQSSHSDQTLGWGESGPQTPFEDMTP